jgi:hypothetical protein
MWKKFVAVSLAVLVAPPLVAAEDSLSPALQTDPAIDLCVAEVGKRTLYDDASRVVHRVIEAEQKNLVERRYRINTLVYASDKQSVMRSYEAVCVTRGPLKVIRFAIDEQPVERTAADL